MRKKVCPECGQYIDEQPGWLKAIIATVFVAVLVGIGYAIGHVAWVA